VLRTRVVLFYFNVQYSSVLSVQYFSLLLVFSICVPCSILF
jgi:hypothetical protein